MEPKKEISLEICSSIDNFLLGKPNLSQQVLHIKRKITGGGSVKAAPEVKFCKNLIKKINESTNAIFACDYFACKNIRNALNGLANYLKANFKENADVMNYVWMLDNIDTVIKNKEERAYGVHVPYYSLPGDVENQLVNRFLGTEKDINKILPQLKALYRYKKWKMYEEILPVWMDLKKIAVPIFSTLNFNESELFIIRSHLTHLSVTNQNKLSCKHVNKLLRTCDRTKTLYIEHKKLSQIDFENITIKLEKIVCKKGRFSGNHFEKLDLTFLKHLELLDCKMYPEDLQVLAGCSRLETLKFSECPIGDEVLKKLILVPHIKQFTCHKLNKLTNAGLQGLTGLTALTKLSFQECDIPQLSLHAISHLTNLNSLILYNTPHLVVESLSSLHKLTKLEKLDFSFCQKVDDTSLYTVTKLFTRLKVLKLLSCKQITDQGLFTLSQLCNLKKLNLYCCHKISNAGLDFLTTLNELEDLELAGCNLITDEGFKKLVHLKKLKKISITGCDNISDQAVCEVALLNADINIQSRYN